MEHKIFGQPKEGPKIILFYSVFSYLLIPILAIRKNCLSYFLPKEFPASLHAVSQPSLMAEHNLFEVAVPPKLMVMGEEKSSQK